MHRRAAARGRREASVRDMGAPQGRLVTAWLVVSVPALAGGIERLVRRGSLFALVSRLNRWVYFQRTDAKDYQFMGKMSRVFAQPKNQPKDWFPGIPGWLFYSNKVTLVDPTGFEPAIVGVNSTGVTNYLHGPLQPGENKNPY